MNHGEQIGEGHYKKVYDHESDPEKVHAEFKESLTDENIKTAFYLGKIVHIFFPENVPDIHLAGNKLDKDADVKTSYFVAEKLESDEKKKETDKRYIAYLSGDNMSEAEVNAHMRDDFEMERNPAVIKFIKKAAAIGIEVDDGGHNFFIKDGVVKTFEIEHGLQKYPSSSEKEGTFNAFDEQKLRAAIETLPDPQKEKAKIYFERLVALHKPSPKTFSK